MSARNARTGSVDPRPLLSICIPTCNRADFLRVMLQALLPQVREFGDQVEVWVLDNASTDQTPQVLAESTVLGPFRVHRQHQNVGPTRNIVCGPARLATGHFVWVLGDHNLLRPGALQRVLECLNQHRSQQLFYVNFRCAVYPIDWPGSALGGHEGSFRYTGNPEITDGVMPRWYQLLRPCSAACTQNYVHIVDTQIWRDFWKDEVKGDDYSSAETTYPHTLTIVNAALHRPVVVMAEPVITIFNGAQSWGNPVTRVKVFFVGLPELLKRFGSGGVPEENLRELWRKFYFPEAGRVIREACRSRGRWSGLGLVLRHLGTNWRGWWLLLTLLPEILLPRLTRAAQRLANWCGNYRNWYIFNFRPARWVRSLNAERKETNAGVKAEAASRNGC